MLIGSLVELHAWLHSYLCFSLFEKLFLSNLDSFSTPSFLSSFSTSSYRNLDSFSTVRWIDRDFFWTLDSISTTGGSIEKAPNLSIASQQLLNNFSIHRGWLDTSRSIEILLHALFLTCFAFFFYLVNHSILFHYIRVFLWILCAPLIIFDHLYLSRVKRPSFLYSLSIMTKRGRNCGNMWFLFKDSIC